MKVAPANGVRHFYEFGPFRLDPNRHRLLREGELVPLSGKAIEILTLLVQNPGKLLEREALMQAVWRDTIVEDANLTVAISQLRKAINENGDAAEFIQTIPRIGYRFVADLREVEEELAPLRIDMGEEIGVHNGQPSSPADAAKSLTAPERTAFPLTKTRLALVLGIVLLIAGAVILYRNLPSSVESGTIRSVAILPLKNLTGDPNNEYVADGLTEGLISSLSKIKGLKVISGGSVFAFKGREINPHEVGRQLGVMSVIEGSLLKSKDSARVWLRLVNTEDGRVLWADDGTEHTLADVFAIQDELARTVISSVRPRTTANDARQINRRYTQNAEAFQLYAKGRHFWNKRTGPDLERAINYFEQAINLDSNYALAYSGLADCYAVLGYFTNHPLDETFPKAKAVAEKALEIDSGLAEPHATLGLVQAYYLDWKHAENEYKRALEINPNYATAHHWYSWYLIHVGRREESVQEMRRALELDPVSIEINVDLGAVLLDAYRPDEAIPYFKAALEMDQNFVEAIWGLGRAYMQKAQFEQSITELERARQLSQDRADILAELGAAYALAGKTPKALSILAQLKTIPDENNVSPYDLAKVYVGLGEKEKALTALEAAWQSRSTEIIRINSETVFDPLRNEPRFQKILMSVGLMP